MLPRTELLLILVCALFSGADSFAQWMTTDFCARSLTPGEVIMNQPALTDEERHVILRKDDNLDDGVANPYSFTNSDNLAVYISDIAQENEFVFEIQGDGAVFVDGGCQGKRSTKNGAKLDLSQAVGPFSIVAGKNPVI